MWLIRIQNTAQYQLKVWDPDPVCGVPERGAEKAELGPCAEGPKLVVGG